MLETLIFQMITPFFINPGDPNSTEAYSSGVGEVQNSYATDKTPTEYPMITFNVIAYDYEFNHVTPGIYAVDLSPDAGKLLILRGMEVVARCYVIQAIELDDEQRAAVPTAEIAFIKDNKVFIVYKNENLEVHGFLYKSDILPDF